MRYLKTQNRYKSKNCTFDVDTCKAVSYGWWVFVDKIDGMVVFNSYRYSVTTAGHQRKVRQLLEELGIRIDLEIECPAGLQDISSAAQLYADRSGELLQQLQKKGTRANKNKQRRSDINRCQDMIKQINRLMAGKMRWIA